MAKQRKESRPSIWAEGRQNPPFEARAFALASVQMARLSLAGLLARSGAAGQGLGASVASGRWRLPPERWGRTGRYLPSVEATGAAISFAAEVLAEAGKAVSAASEEVEAHQISLPPRMEAQAAPSRAIIAARSDASPVRPARPQPSAGPIARPVPKPTPVIAANDDLAAVRLVIANAEIANAEIGPAQYPLDQRKPAESQPNAFSSIAAPPPPANAPITASKYAALLSKTGAAALTGFKSLPIKRDWLVKALAYPLGYGLLVAAVPVGMVRATLAHLNGQDLRKLVAE